MITLFLLLFLSVPAEAHQIWDGWDNSAHHIVLDMGDLSKADLQDHESREKMSNPGYGKDENGEYEMRGGSKCYFGNLAAPYEEHGYIVVYTTQTLVETENGRRSIIVPWGRQITLAEFVSSGRFCAWRGGHVWSWQSNCAMVSISESEAAMTQQCLICHRCRQRIMVKKEGMDWEE